MNERSGNGKKGSGESAVNGNGETVNDESGRGANTSTGARHTANYRRRENDI